MHVAHIGRKRGQLRLDVDVNSVPGDECEVRAEPPHEILEVVPVDGEEGGAEK